MANYNGSQSLRGFSIISLVFGLLGVVFFWWVPLGMVLSLAGLFVGSVDWLMARRHSFDLRMSVAGILLSVAAFTLDVVIAAMGLQTVTFTSLR